MIELTDLGFNCHFQNSFEKYNLNPYHPARVIAVNRDNYILRNETREVTAEMTGKLLFEAESTQNFPTVGDWVFVDYFNEETFCVIHGILPRLSLLKRKAAGKTVDYQLVAANIDTAFIMQSVDFNFNLNRLHRYLVMVNEGNIKPIVLLSKTDLISSEDLGALLSEIQNSIGGIETIPFSSVSGKGIEIIHRVIKQGQTYCLLGSSGVGKTTLLNHIIGEDRYAVNTVREKDGKGRHTTNRRQLIFVEGGGMIIDTPGMRELGNFGADSGIHETFKDVVSFAENCRYANCTHINEPDCAVLQAIEENELDVKRYQSYIKLRKESEHYQMSYIEKRRRDRQFGKMVKEVKKFDKRKKSTR
jgi:ribosome biogenesis GTPase